MSESLGAIRTFIAIDTPQEVKELFSKLNRELRRIGRDKISWVRPEGVHLTLRFLGDLDQSAVKKVCEATTIAALQAEEFEINLDDVGAFPNFARPKSLWIGVEGGPNILRLFKNIDIALKNTGFEFSGTKFHPHLTLGRVKELELNSPLVNSFLAIKIPQISWRVKSVKVFSSSLKPTGAEYHCIEEIMFTHGNKSFINN